MRKSTDECSWILQSTIRWSSIQNQGFNAWHETTPHDATGTVRLSEDSVIISRNANEQWIPQSTLMICHVLHTSLFSKEVEMVFFRRPAYKARNTACDYFCRVADAAQAIRIWRSQGYVQKNSVWRNEISWLDTNVKATYRTLELLYRCLRRLSYDSRTRLKAWCVAVYVDRLRYVEPARKDATFTVVGNAARIDIARQKMAPGATK